MPAQAGIRPRPVLVAILLLTRPPPKAGVTARFIRHCELNHISIYIMSLRKRFTASRRSRINPEPDTANTRGDVPYRHIVHEE
mgnify:CR=1 FL=1|jgi:hypothetical protein